MQLGQLGLEAGKIVKKSFASDAERLGDGGQFGWVGSQRERDGVDRIEKVAILDQPVEDRQLRPHLVPRTQQVLEQGIQRVDMQGLEVQGALQEVAPSAKSRDLIGEDEIGLFRRRR